MTALTRTFTQVVCLTCGHTMRPTLSATHCDQCGSQWLDARYDYPQVGRLWPTVLGSRDTTLWRYHELLPIVARLRVSMSEGWSPLLRAERLGKELGLRRLYVKDERQSPTSSFKDRQATLVVSALKAIGIDEVVMASTGNAATAYAAYCARAGIKLWVFVTSSVPAEKMREIALYGAEVIKVSGTYDQTKVVAARFAERHGLYYEQGAKAIVSKESMKTIAFEIAEQLNWHAPDWYIQAVSGGIGPIGVWKGFHELLQAGLIRRVPRLAIVQVEGCQPMVQAFKADHETAKPVIPQTRISILATGDPGYGYTILYEAVKSNRGAMVSVSDEEAFRALRHLARTEGLSVEPATAVAFAGLEKLVREGIVRPSHTVVVNASGHTLPVEKFVLGEQYVVDIELRSQLVEQWGMPEEGLGAALELLDEKATRVVVIDDSPRDSRLIRRLLQRHKSYRVYEAHTAPEGIELVREQLPDLVVLDLMMPDMSGFDVLDALKADPITQQIPVIVVSGKVLTDQERERLKQQTVSLWLKGSYKTHDLAEHIVELLGQHSEPGPEPATSAPLQPAAENATHTVLVVEDNPLDGRLLRRTLDQQGICRVVEAHSAEQALLMLRQSIPDLIILDLMLPDMSGFELLEVVRTDPSTRDIPVVVLTAKELSSDERARLEKLVDSTWTKGAIDRMALQERVAKLIGTV